MISAFRSLLSGALRAAPVPIPQPSTRATRPERVLLIAFFDPEGLKTISENVARLCGLSRFGYSLLNLHGGFHPFGLSISRKVDLRSFDCILIHCTVAYNPANLESLDRQLRCRLDQYAGLKVLMKQDEHFRTHATCDYIASRHFDLVLTCATPENVKSLYPVACVPRVSFLHALTGYVSDDLRGVATQFPLDRATDIGYRGSLQPLHFGRLAYEKREIGDRVAAALEGRGLRLDISSRWEDRFMGDEWFKFLCRCKSVLGVESGASIVDFDGEAERLCTQYLKKHPKAHPEEVLVTVKHLEGNAYYKAISPRHFEAAACKTLQIMYEGEYQGIFQPGRHFFPLKRDLTNLDEAVALLQDESARTRMTEAAFEEIVMNDKYHYRSFVGELDDAMESLFDDRKLGLAQRKESAGT